MLDSRSVYVSSADRYPVELLVLQPGIRRSCQCTAETCVVQLEVLLRHSQPVGIVTGRLLGQAALIGMSRSQFKRKE